jgi:hypothetical protein
MAVAYSPRNVSAQSRTKPQVKIENAPQSLKLRAARSTVPAGTPAIPVAKNFCAR